MALTSASIKLINATGGNGEIVVDVVVVEDAVLTVCETPVVIGMIVPPTDATPLYAGKGNWFIMHIISLIKRQKYQGNIDLSKKRHSSSL